MPRRLVRLSAPMSMHRSSRPLSVVIVALLAVAASAVVPLVPAAENFACGAGGTPDPKTATCICPPGKIEKTTGGTSRCIDKPTIKPAPSPSPSAKPSAKPTSTPSSVPTVVAPPPPIPSTTQMPTVAPPTPTFVPVPVPVPVPTCAPGKVWNGVSCNDVAPAGACFEGQVRVDGAHCCWPGQAWSDASHLCVGAPACPDGYQASGLVPTASAIRSSSASSASPSPSSRRSPAPTRGRARCCGSPWGGLRSSFDGDS